MAPTTALIEALWEMNAEQEFASLSGDARLLLLSAVLGYGRELLLTNNGAADEAYRFVTATTGSQRLGEAASKAARRWAARVS
jgi:hypothetical protein